MRAFVWKCAIKLRSLIERQYQAYSPAHHSMAARVAELERIISDANTYPRTECGHIDCGRFGEFIDPSTVRWCEYHKFAGLYGEDVKLVQSIKLDGSSTVGALDV